MNHWQSFSASVMLQHSTPEHPSVLFKGFLLRWNRLTQSEKVVCLGIVLIPLWWFWGWSYLLLFLGLGVFAYDLIKKGTIRLKKPSLLVIALVAYGLYDLITTVFYGFYNSSALSPRDLIGAINTIFSPAFILWYIQSRDIRVRLQVVAWAFSLLVVLMLGSWAYIFFVRHQVAFEPPRSLFGLLTHKPVEYAPGLGNTNYLMPYRAEDSSLPGFARYFYFFHGPESLALVSSFICLLSFDLKQHRWKLLLCFGAVFILLTSGTRSVWLTLPCILTVRWLLTASQATGAWFISALIATVSIVGLMLPPVTNQILDTVSGTAKATSEFRGDSTDVRAEIYRRTAERLLDSNNWQLLVGHVVPGETVLPGYAPAMVGTHSFYLGSLFYIRGILGTAIFAVYWISLIAWLIKTRKGRPLGCILIFFLFSLVFCVMVLESVVMPIVLIAVVTRNPKLKSGSFQTTQRPIS